MCDPTGGIATAVALGLGAAGAAAQSAGEGKSNKARGKAMNDERARQQNYRNINLTSANDTLTNDSFPAQAQYTRDAVARRQGAYAGAVTNGVPFSSPIAPSSPVIAQEMQRASGTAQNKSLSEALAKAQLDAYGDAQQRSGIRSAHNAQNIGLTSGFAKESSNILPLELDSANHAGDNWRQIGDLLTMGSQAVGAFGLPGFGAAAGAPKFGVDFGSRLFAPPTVFA